MTHFIIEEKEINSDYKYLTDREQELINKIKSTAKTVELLDIDDVEIESWVKNNFSLGLTGDSYEKSANKSIIDSATISDVKTIKKFIAFLKSQEIKLFKQKGETK